MHPQLLNDRGSKHPFDFSLLAFFADACGWRQFQMPSPSDFFSFHALTPSSRLVTL
jgi:hypothetical protein